MTETTDTNDAPQRFTALLLLDGKTMHHITAFDTVEGWVEKLCTGEKPGHPCEPHEDPEGRDLWCMAPRLHGHVEWVEVEGP